MADPLPAPAPRSLALRNAHPHLRVPRAALARAVRLLDAHAVRFRGGCPAGELSVVFLTDAALARIHADFMDDPSPTDVITFEPPPTAPGGAEPAAGEICVSADAAARQTGRPSRGAAAAFAAELTLYVVHGWLHLAGYDDRKPVHKRQMRAAERRALQLLRAAGAVPAFRLA